MPETSNILYDVATWLIPLTFAIVFHEVAHGYTARLFGDRTAAIAGRLSLNPLRHVDPVGTVILPLVLAISGGPIFGWAKPVPVVASQMRHPRWNMMLVALAGPASNIVLAIATVLAFMWFTHHPLTYSALTPFMADNAGHFIMINVMLAVFNLLPIPPFDGSHVVEGLLPRAIVPAYARFQRFGLLIPLLLFIVVPLVMPQSRLLDRLIGPPVSWVLEQLSALGTAFGAML